MKNEGPVEKRYASMIRYLRELVGVTQAEMAEKLNVKANTVARWESGVREPYSWNYWSLFAFAAFHKEWDIATWFQAKVESAEEGMKWGRREILRHLKMVRGLADAGDARAIQVLKDSERERSDYIRENLSEIDQAWFAPLPDVATSYRDEDQAEGRQALRDWEIRLTGRLIEVMRDVEEVDLLRQGRDLEKLESEEAEQKRQRKITAERAEALRKQFELLASQRQHARNILRGMQFSEADGELYDWGKAMNKVRRALGIEFDEDTAETKPEDTKPEEANPEEPKPEEDNGK